LFLDSFEQPLLSTSSPRVDRQPEPGKDAESEELQEHANQQQPGAVRIGTKNINAGDLCFIVISGSRL